MKYVKRIAEQNWLLHARSAHTTIYLSACNGCKRREGPVQTPATSTDEQAAYNSSSVGSEQSSRMIPQPPPDQLPFRSSDKSTESRPSILLCDELSILRRECTSQHQPQSAQSCNNSNEHECVSCTCFPTACPLVNSGQQQPLAAT